MTFSDSISTARRILGVVAFCVLLGGTGIFILYKFHDGWALLVGSLFILIALGTAFPTNMHTGIMTFRANAADLTPAVRDILTAPPKENHP